MKYFYYCCGVLLLAPSELNSALWIRAAAQTLILLLTAASVGTVEVFRGFEAEVPDVAVLVTTERSSGRTTANFEPSRTRILSRLADK